MFKVLDNVMSSVAGGGQQRKVQKYLNEATTGSVLLDLCRELRYIGHDARFRSIFQAWCLEEPSQPAHWTVKSFQAYIESVHAGIASSEIELLWRCFAFHAYHPFPHDTDSTRIDVDGFVRAATLLAAHGADFLGKVEKGDYYLHHDEKFYRKADFRRIFRSISRRTTSATTEKNIDSDVVVDTVSVLTMVAPYFIHSAPSPDQLESTARKLLDEHGSARAGHVVCRKDFSTLLRLLLRTSLEKSTWGQDLHRGSFDFAESTDEVLTDALVVGVLPNSTREDLTGEELGNVMDLLPNIQLRFYQMWSLIFQPQKAKAQAQSDEPESVPFCILRAISLFVPQCIATKTGPEQLSREDTRYVLERSVSLSQAKDIMSLTHLQDRLTTGPWPHLVLCSNNSDSPQHTVLGAYFPGPIALQSSPGSERRSTKTTSSHLLFQLLPHFCVFRWDGGQIPLPDLFVPSESVQVEASAPGADVPLTPYVIGVPGSEGTHLRIDPGTQIVTLTHRVDPTDTRMRYKQIIGIDSTVHNPELEWTGTVEHARIDIFRLTGPAEPEPQRRYEPPKRIDAGGLGGAELAMRITGFGSNA